MPSQYFKEQVCETCNSTEFNIFEQCCSCAEKEIEYEKNGYYQVPKSNKLKNRKDKYFWLSLFIVFILLCLTSLFGYFIFDCYKTHSIHYEVIDVYWKHSGILQQRYTIHDSSWIEEMPPYYFDNVCSTQIRNYYYCNPVFGNELLEKEECILNCISNNNDILNCEDQCGAENDEYCEYQCPIFDEYCDYSFYKFETISSDMISGHTNRTIEPALMIQNNQTGPQQLKIRRYYQITFRNEITGDVIRYNPENIQDFNRFRKEQRWTFYTSNSFSKPLVLVHN